MPLLKKTSEEILKLAIESMHEGLQIIGFDWRYIYVNSAAAKHGRKPKAELIGKFMSEVYPGIDTSAVFKDFKYVMESRRPRRLENWFQYEDGSHQWFELFLEPHQDGILIRSIDISERKKIEEQLLHSQKMESIGKLAGGMAHEFNNKLATMMTYTELAQGELAATDTQVRGYLDAVMTAVGQASTLTKKILAFSRSQVLTIEITDLNELLQGMNVALANFLGANVRVSYVLGKELHPVNVDHNQMEQTILNLCINAREAIPAHGEITIETSNVELDEEYCRAHSKTPPGRYVLLTVSDTGAGMDKATLAKVFEPFFTTKEKGTGLGLSMVFGFVKQCNGNIWVYSEPGMGTVFKIYLPAIYELPNYESGEKKPTTSYSGSECILMVEDDDLLRTAYETALTRAGYIVLACRDGLEAKKLFINEPDKIHMVLTDVVLPKLKGSDLAVQLRKLKPDLKVVFMSGYTENSIVHQGILDTESVLLQKPISIRSLLETVRKVIDAAAPAGDESS